MTTLIQEIATPFAQSVFTETHRRLFTPPEVDLVHDLPKPELDALKGTLNWLRTFIMKPHPNLGRGGVVCPYVKMAMEDSLLYLSVAQPEDPYNHKSIYREMDVYLEMFDQFEPKEGNLANLRCIMVLFPYTPEKVFDDPPGLKQFKAYMMREGITIGQFFPTTNMKKLLKDKFFPIQVAAPVYIMRPFAEFDWVFINGEPEWRAEYKRRFGGPPTK